MDWLGRAKDLYFRLEDAYYAVLDTLQPRVPVYSLVDPVDKILPSFGIILALVFALVVFTGFSALTGGGVSDLSFTFTDSSGAPVEGVSVSLTSVSSDHTDAGFTDEAGNVVLRVPAGDYALTAEKSGFEPFSQSISVSNSTARTFSLDLAAPASVSRTLLIQDAQGGILGTLSPVSISLSFSCQSGAPPSPQTVSNGNVTILLPPSCLGLSVNVSAPGFVPKTQLIVGDHTVIVLDSEALLEGPPLHSDVGTVEVVARDVTSAGVSGMQAKLYKVPAAGSQILSNQSLTDGSGFALFQDVAPGKYVVIATRSGFQQSVSAEFQVNAGETKTINLVVNPSSTKRKVFVKIVSQLNQLPVSGASVTLHVHSVGGSYLEYDTYTTDANGVVSQPLADFNGDTQLVVKASNFVTRILPATGVVSEDELTPASIAMDPLDLANANGSIPNAAVVDVKVSDPLNLAVSGARVNVFSPDANGVRVDTLLTNASGVAHFSSLPEGVYQATATTPIADGVSPALNAQLGVVTVLPITMDVGNALIQVTVKDEQNTPLPDANVFIVNRASNAIVAQGKTNASGLVQLGAQTDQSVFVRVTKNNYLPFSSVPFDVIKDNTHQITIEVGLTAATQQVAMTLVRITELTQTLGSVPAQTLVPGNSYAFHFSVRTPSAQTAWKAMARVNPDVPASQQDAAIGQILNAESALGGVSFFSTYNSADAFAPSGPVNSGVPAKVSLNQMGDVNGAGAWEYVVVVKINPSAVPNVDKLELRFQSKSSTQTSPLYQESYTVGQPLPAQGDFSFVFFLAEQGSTDQRQVSPALPITIEQNKNYTLTYAVANHLATPFPTAQVTFGSTTPGSFTFSPAQASLPGFNANAVVSGTVTLRSTSTCSSSTPYCSTFTLLLSSVGANHSPTSASLQFYTVPEKQLLLSTTPSFLIPGLAQVVQAVAVDNIGNPLTPAQNVQIQGQLTNAAGAAIGSPISFTGNSHGVFLASIPPAAEGEHVVVTASAAGFLSDVKTLPVSTQLVLNFSQDFSCLTFSPGSVSFQRGAVGNLTVQAVNCPEPITLYTSGFTENGNVVSLTVRNGPVIITPSAPLSLGGADSKTLTIVSPSWIGQYPLYVWAKYASQSEFSLVRNIDVTVVPLSGSTQCLNLSKYAFDLTLGSDAAVIQNNCNPRVPSPFLPSAQLGVNGVYVHALPPLVSPAMQYATSPLSFNWSVRVDYNGSDNPDFNHADLVRAPAVPEGKWNRYKVGSQGFVPEKSFFVSDTPELVSDGPTTDLESQGMAHYDPSVKAVMYETTLVLPNKQTFLQLCTQVSGLLVTFRLDGQLVGSTVTEPAPQTVCANNVTLSPGPHSIQLFLNDTAPGGYYVRFYYRKGTGNPPALNLNASQGQGFIVSPNAGIPASNDLVPNGVYTLGPFIGTITPLSAASEPVYLASLSGPIRDILTNAGGVDHLKQAYLQTFSDNPQVRVFVKDDGVYAQFLGVDDPAGPQNVVVENVGMVGEKYGVMTLRDYTTPTGASPVVDVGVLLDSSSSLFTQLLANSFAPVGNTSYAQSGLCSVIQNISRSMQEAGGAAVRYKLFLTSVPAEYHSGLSALPCSDSQGNPVVLPVASNPPSYDPLTDDRNESWAAAAQAVSNDSFWQSPNRALVMVTDNKPYGSGPQSPANAWKGNAEQTLVNAAASALNAKSIHGIVWYKTPIESNQTTQVGGSSRNDAIELMDSLAAQTGGFVEALDFGEFVPASVPASQKPFALSQNNRFVVRLLQTVFDIREERIVVKLTSTPPQACVSESGDVGTTGASAVPHVLLNWSWGAVDPAVCDRKAAPQAGEFRYCDATQFGISLVKKLRLLEQAYAPDANASLAAQIPFLTSYDAYLMRDAFNADFRTDFKEFFVNSSFADAPAYFKNSVSGAWKDYIDPGFDNLDFTVAGQPAAVQTLPQSGLYRVNITIEWQSDPGVFFVASSPAAKIHVTFTPLAAAVNLDGYSAFYELPLDGLVGVNPDAQLMHREGYGAGFSGSVVDLVQTPGYTLRSYPAQPGTSALRTLAVATSSTFVGLNTQDRGTLVDLDLSAGRLTITPSLPAPVVVEWSSNPFGQGSVYYGIQETDALGQTGFVSYSAAGNPSIGNWVPVASVAKQPSFGCTSASCAICLDAGSRPYAQAVVGDSNPVAASCAIRPPLTATNAFGFTSSSGAANTAYLGTVFYRVPQNSYSILLACNDSPTQEIGSILTLNGALSNGVSSVSTLDLGGTGLESQLAGGQTLFGMLNLISPQWTCVSSGSTRAKVYWNAPKLREYVMNQNPSFGQLTGNACVATGSPISTVQFWTLREESAPLAVTASNAGAYCRLFNTNSSAGWYAQSGVPVPVGTVLNVGTAVGPNTGDGLNSLVQYRALPTGCDSNHAGYPSCAGAGSYNYCASNTQRKWEGIPNIAP